jgi:Arm DNA-binding domain
MKNVKLTATSVRALALPAGKGDYIVFDTDVPGFGLRLRAEGSRGFVFQYKIGSKQRRMALGAASAISIGDARKTAERLYAQAKLGLDPAGDKAEAKAAASETSRRSSPASSRTSAATCAGVRIAMRSGTFSSI